MNELERLSLVTYELRRRKKSFEILIRDENYPEQDRFVMDKAQFLGACTTRRAGKSNGLGLRFLRTLQRHPGSKCLYIALTRDSARGIMWNELQEMDERLKLGAKFVESSLTMIVPGFGDGTLKLVGADMKNFRRRLRGQKWPGVGVDEAQEFADLEDLVDNVLTPGTSDYADGWIALTGTPGPVPHGYFHDVTEEGKHGYSLHAWSLFRNPYLPNPKKFVAELKKKKQWPDDHPTLLREYYGKWVFDLNALVFKYDAEKNSYDTLPKLKGKWEHVLGIDIGWHDADSISCIGWHEKIKEAYLLEEDVARGQGITELVARIERFIKIYDPIKIVIDTAGLGKKIAEELRRRYGIPVHAAEKVRMYEFIELLNDEMRCRRFYAKRDSQFAKDAARLKWDTESVKPKISDAFHSDALMSALYGWREALQWLHEPERIKPKKGSPEAIREEEDELEEAAEHAFVGGTTEQWGNEWEQFK